MAAVASGDEGAFDSLYERYSPTLYALCLRILGNACDAQTVILDVFWEVWRSRERYDPNRGSARTYLATLTRSRAIDHLRATKRLVDHQQQLAADRHGTLTDQQHQDGPPQRAIHSENEQLLHAALEHLTHAQREALELAYFQGLTHREIAKRTDTPLGSVKTHIRQGLIKLRKVLHQIGSEGMQR